MVDEQLHLNPYAPPAEQVVQPAPHDAELKLWREGERLMVRNGAEFPSICFVTGVPTNSSVIVQQVWQPPWVYFLLIPFLFPYFLVSPFVHRKVTLDVPLADYMVSSHQNLVRLGIKLILIGICLFVLWLVLPTILEFQSQVVLLACLASIIAGLILASRQPVRLSIDTFEADTLVLKHVSSQFLEQVPQLSVFD